MKTKALAQSALIGALYALFTFISLPISSGLIQLRVSEALCVLPYFTPYAVPGLFVGCIIANIIAGGALYDVIFGSLATLLAAAFTRLMWRCGVSRYLAPLPAVIINALVVGEILVLVYGEAMPYWTCVLYVGVGQTLACFGLGLPLMAVLERHKDKMF
ncbi:MAG: QueT transporter family protein [Clostridia bacterium]